MRSLLIVLAFCLFVTPAAFAAEVRLSVAASMTDAMKELLASYRQGAEGVSFLTNFASSGSLARQIAQGAPADIFISANPDWMTYLVEAQRVPAERVRTVAVNHLVFVGRAGLPVARLGDLVRLERIAIGSPRSVPAGQYAEQALKAAGLYDQLAARLVMARDVRQALVYADRGEVDGAFVYRTDAFLAREAVILLEVPQGLHDAVTYPAGLTVTGVQKPAAVDFFAFLQTPEAAAVLERHGFGVR